MSEKIEIPQRQFGFASQPLKNFDEETWLRLSIEFKSIFRDFKD